MSNGVRGPCAGEGRRGGFRFRSLRTARIAAIPIASLGQSQREEFVGEANLKEILVYFHTAWDSLTRSTTSCSKVADAKLLAAPVRHLPAGFDLPTEPDRMQRDGKVTVARLPVVMQQLATVDLESGPAAGIALPRERVHSAGRAF